MLKNLKLGQDDILAEELWYYDVPAEYMNFDCDEKELLGEESQWSQINFTRPPCVPKFWKAGMPKDAFSSENFLTEFFWDMKKDDEVIKIKSLLYKKEQTSLFSEEKLLLEAMDYIASYGDTSCILYESKGVLKRAVMLYPGENMYIYFKTEEIACIKEILSRYGKETNYYSYELNEL